MTTWPPPSQISLKKTYNTENPKIMKIWDYQGLASELAFPSFLSCLQDIEMLKQAQEIPPTTGVE